MATIDEEKKRRTAFPTDLPESGYLKNRPVPPSGFEGAGQRYAQGMQRSGLMPGPASKPVSVDGIGGSTAAVLDGSAREQAEAFKDGRYAQGMGAIVRGAAALPVALGMDAIKPLRPIGDAAAGFFRGLTGTAADPTGASKPGTTAAMDPNKPTAAPQSAAPTAAEQQIPLTDPQLQGKPPGTNPAGEVVQRGTEIAPGVFRQGRGQYSDNPEGMGFPAGFTGRPSAQNMQAAENLAQRSAARIAQPQAEAQGPSVSIMRDTSGGAGMSREEANMLRTLTMNAQQLKPGARAALRAFQESIAQRKAADLSRDRMGMESQNAAADRGLRQQELTARMGDAEATRALRAQELGDNMATNAVRREAAGFEVQNARRLQKLQDQYLAATTDKERGEIAAKIQALQGKSQQEQANRFTVVPGGQEVQMVGGFPTPVTRPSMVINNQTGQLVDLGGGQQAQLPPGMVKQVGTSGGKPVYEDATGKRFVGE